jgi:hypothetical protein
MIWWLKTRYAHICAVTMAMMALILYFSDNLHIPFPNLLHGSWISIPVALLLPTSVSIVVAFGLTAGDPFVEAIASRPLRLLDVIYTLAMAIITLAMCMLVWTIKETPLAMAAGRNALGYVGLTLIGRRMLGAQAAAILPAAFALASPIVGLRGTGEPHVWTWSLVMIDDTGLWVISWVAASALLLIGAAMNLYYSNIT